jgi:hypothetical protein
MTAPTLSNFLSELRTRNVSKPNLYYVKITPPSRSALLDSDLVSMWCSGATTPQMSIATNDDYIEAGVRRKYAYDQDFQNLILSFYIDQDYVVKNFFDRWKNLIVPQRRNFNYPDSYTADKLQVYIINQDNQETYLYTYTRVFPKTIQAIELSYATGTAISTFTVELVFEDVQFTKITNGIETSNTSIPRNNILETPLTEGIENSELLNNMKIEGSFSSPFSGNSYINQINNIFT